MIARWIRAVRLSWNSMAAQILVLLIGGMLAAAITALLVAEHARKKDVERVELDRVVASVTDVLDRLRQYPDTTEAALSQRQIRGLHPGPDDISRMTHTPHLDEMLAKRLYPAAHPMTGQMDFARCFPTTTPQAAGNVTPEYCWIIEVTDMEGRRRRFAATVHLADPFPSVLYTPAYIAIIVFVTMALSIIVARLASSPLRRLQAAAMEFSLSMDVEPIPERGPTEVRAALATFNVMRQRVHDGYAARTQLLAGISHDLQTPMTRLRLRIEHVEDDVLRDRLIGDLAAMQSLVSEGLDLARSSESSEPWSAIDIDSLLVTLVEEFSEFDQNVHFDGSCGGVVRAKPNALHRCLTNLLDNAIEYGGDAVVGCSETEDRVTICVRDHGPGIREDLLQTMFEPFTRGEPGQPGGRKGTGIGLTIAKSQALTFGARVELANHPEGGLVASVEIPKS